MFEYFDALTVLFMTMKEVQMKITNPGMIGSMKVSDLSEQ